jgi:hypothetical protein
MDMHMIFLAFAVYNPLLSPQVFFLATKLTFSYSKKMNG